MAQERYTNIRKDLLRGIIDEKEMMYTGIMFFFSFDIQVLVDNKPQMKSIQCASFSNLKHTISLGTTNNLMQVRTLDLEDGMLLQLNSGELVPIYDFHYKMYHGTYKGLQVIGELVTEEDEIFRYNFFQQHYENGKIEWKFDKIEE